MGNEASSHLASIGKCCASEEIEEVVKRDGAQTLSFDQGTTTEGSPDCRQQNDSQLAAQPRGEQVSNKWGTFETRPYVQNDVDIVVRLQAAFRGIITRKMIR